MNSFKKIELWKNLQCLCIMCNDVVNIYIDGKNRERHYCSTHTNINKIHVYYMYGRELIRDRMSDKFTRCSISLHNDEMCKNTHSDIESQLWDYLIENNINIDRLIFFLTPRSSIRITNDRYSLTADVYEALINNMYNRFKIILRCNYYENFLKMKFYDKSILDVAREHNANDIVILILDKDKFKKCFRNHSFVFFDSLYNHHIMKIENS